MRGLARLFLLLAALPLLAAASEPVLVPDASQREITIRSDFTGAELLLFGAIAYPQGRVPSGDIDVAIVLKGPAEAIMLREKRKIAGIWINAESQDFRSAPGFYAIASSRPIDRIVDAKTAAIYELGLDHLQLSPAGAIVSADINRYEAGLVDLRRRAGLYRDAEGSVEISDAILYRARIEIPASVPVGDFTAETFLIEDGRVVAAATRDITIVKAGFGRFVTRLARQQSLLYGLIAVSIALALGWIAGTVFRKI